MCGGPGKPIGVPKTGVFGLYDLIGIDLMPHLAGSLLSTLPENGIFSRDIILTPSDQFVENFNLLESDTGFIRATTISILVAAAYTVLSVALTSMAGWSLACYRFAGKGVVLATILGTLTLPYFVVVIPQFIMGARGMPRRYFDYDPRFELMHQLSSLGAFIMGITLFCVIVNLLISLKNGKKAPNNPWGGTTLEWQTSSPPPLYNFPIGKPIPLPDLYEYGDLVQDPDGGWHYKSDATAKESEG